MADHFQNIYMNHADRYDLMIQREDYESNLPRTLSTICSLDNLEAIDLGAGTGRLSRLLAPHVTRLTTCDIAHHMLGEARRTLGAHAHVNLAVGNNLRLPLRSGSADLTIEGWAFGHLNFWYEDWQAAIDMALAEMLRTLKPGGTAIIIETLGTGFTEPTPPAMELARFYTYLEQERGFTQQWIRTDYRFESLDEAIALSQFFFGDELAEQVKQHKWIILPECTGLWYKTKL
jgi:ubiquinone/menaquinone biosynthesis C-methylase UbiE